MDSLFVDPMIFEVAKNCIDSSGGLASYEVMDVFPHHSLFDVFLNPIPYNVGGELEVRHAYLTLDVCFLATLFLLLFVFWFCRITFWMPLWPVYTMILLLIMKRFLEWMNLIMTVVQRIVCWFFLWSWFHLPGWYQWQKEDIWSLGWGWWRGFGSWWEGVKG